MTFVQNDTLPINVEKRVPNLSPLGRRLGSHSSRIDMLTGKGPVRSDDHIIFLQILRSHELGDRAMVNTARQCAWSTVVLNLLDPIRNHRHGADYESGFAILASWLVGLRGDNQAQHGHRFTESHVVCTDGSTSQLRLLARSLSDNVEVVLLPASAL